ncbi:MAG TPA: hypothetical protein VIM25_11995, partial [Candidatus Limnocylindrales bacterium]
MPYLARMIPGAGIAIRPAETDADLDSWIDVRQAVMPNVSAPTIATLRAEERPDRILVLAESAG